MDGRGRYRGCAGTYAEGRSRYRECAGKQARSTFRSCRKGRFKTIFRQEITGEPIWETAGAYCLCLWERGKPYFRDLPFYFNLSHSGDYVLCAVSSAEIGTDIQQQCGKNVERLARRFFTEREAAALEQAGEERETRERLFYRLWARKEAYGKLTGKGIAAALEVDFLPGGTVSSPYGCSSGEVGGKRLLWEEYDSIAGYSIALCRYG